MFHSHPFAMIAALALLTAAAPSAADERGSVTATGQGHVEVAPDIAWLSFGVSARQQTVAEARDEVARGVARLIALARDHGLKDEQISTAALSVSPEFDWHPETRQRRLLGYVVSRQLSFKLTELAKLGDITEQALGLGVTDASPPRFDSSRRAELEAEALAAATRDARRRAEVMAGALGARLGQATRVTAEATPGMPVPMMRMEAADAVALGGGETYTPGLIRVTASVSARFALLTD
jgi:uncharacterized protein